MHTIDSFRERYFFLSNFYPAQVSYNDITYSCNEAAFQAQKTLDNEQRLMFANLSPAKAKSMGRRVHLRSDWENVKVEIMYEIVKAKFEQNPELEGRLLATGNAQLEEGNEWNDTFWGVCQGKGHNNLGLILMKVRKELADAI